MLYIPGKPIATYVQTVELVPKFLTWRVESIRSICE
jgi:hypothetical protein